MVSEESGLEGWVEGRRDDLVGDNGMNEHDIIAIALSLLHTSKVKRQHYRWPIELHVSKLRK